MLFNQRKSPARYGFRKKADSSLHLGYAEARIFVAFTGKKSKMQSEENAGLT